MDLLPDGLRAYYTKKANSVYALVDGLKSGQTKITLPSHGSHYQNMRIIGSTDLQAQIEQTANDIHIEISNVPENASIVVFEFKV